MFNNLPQSKCHDPEEPIINVRQGPSLGRRLKNARLPDRFAFTTCINEESSKSCDIVAVYACVSACPLESNTAI